jgi:glycosyltransferase involved in cell wall biosynthesis
LEERDCAGVEAVEAIKAMRITFFLAYAHLCGGVRVVATYARQLARRGHDVTVISTPPPPIPLNWRVRSLLRGRGWPKPPLREPSPVDGAGVRHVVINPWRYLEPSSIPDADAIVATWWETARWVRDLPASKGAKLYFMQDYGGPGQPLERVAHTWSYGLRIFTISRFLEQLVQKHVPQEVEVIPNAVDLDVFRAPVRSKHAPPTVGFLYTTYSEKGIPVCIEAIRLARQEVQDLRVVAFGAHAPTPDMPLPVGTTYRYRASEAELSGIYASCDAWLFPTRREGFGLPILEAMACRTPVIGTPAGAAPELIGEGGGILVNAEDPVAMARAIVRVARMPEQEWRAMSDAGHRTARRWTWDDASARLEQLLERSVAAMQGGDNENTARYAA